MRFSKYRRPFSFSCRRVAAFRSLIFALVNHIFQILFFIHHAPFDRECEDGHMKNHATITNTEKQVSKLTFGVSLAGCARLTLNMVKRTAPKRTFAPYRCAMLLQRYWWCC